MSDFSKYSVLVVENNANIRTILREMLAAFGVARIEEAETVNAAHRLVLSRKFDIVLLDFFLDRLDGADFTRMVRHDAKCQNRAVPILLMTALPNHSKVLKMRDCGVNDIVAKPLAPKTLFTRMNALLSNPREFVVSEKYVGPCRRRKQMDIPPDLDRRKAKAAA